ncbi:aspartate kinase [Paenibacillus thermotolerans]|uniref:aspartate kinase n=1 Tax=Paenibacillus thermotolerans TaxID=3027807 RepID=UPI002367AC1C|nr:MULTISPECIES: aspartate kinase [unclassified Paenibacillus]
MRILVQKFGGTSLSTAEAREHAIKHIRRALDEQYALVVVVSAMGRRGDPYATDTLLQLMGENGNALPIRERDMLLACGEMISAATLCSLLQSGGIPAVALTGAQAGIVTTDDYGNARITDIQTERIEQYLNQGKVVIVTGFQGAAPNGDFTTLGRGGSDTSATALGAALRAECVDIFTDVDGVLTADPRIVTDAKPLTRVSYAEICNMANNGAKVIHPRAVEIAMAADIPVRVRSTFSDSEGTLVTNASTLQRLKEPVPDRLITGIAHVTNVSQVSVQAAEGQYDLQLRVFKAMAHNGISVDLINVTPSGVAYTVFDSEAERAAALLKELGYEPRIVPDCAKVSVIGGGMNGVPGVMATIIEALTEENVGILQSADSNTTIWVLVRASDTAKAVNALHRKFQLHLSIRH